MRRVPSVDSASAYSFAVGLPGSVNASWLRRAEQLPHQDGRTSGCRLTSTSTRRLTESGSSTLSVTNRQASSCRS